MVGEQRLRGHMVNLPVVDAAREGPEDDSPASHHVPPARRDRQTVNLSLENEHGSVSRRRICCNRACRQGLCSCVVHRAYL
eukprot:scaffold496_cov119-Isochrysis_galbana.AAC.10